MEGMKGRGTFYKFRFLIIPIPSHICYVVIIIIAIESLAKSISGPCKTYVADFGSGDENLAGDFFVSQLIHFPIQAPNPSVLQYGLI